MSKVSINRACNWDDNQVASLREGMDRKLTELGIVVEWQDDLAAIAGKGVKGRCRLNNSGVSLELKLDMFASMFKTTIETKLEDYLDSLEQAGRQGQGS